MVGIMASYSRKKLEGLMSSAKSATELPPKLHRLRNLRRDLKRDDSCFPIELLPHLFDLLSDQFGAVRKFVVEILGDIGLKYVELLPEIVPLLIKSLNDETPAVSRQAIASGADLFHSTLERVAVQGLHSSELDQLLESSWTWMIKFKDEICSMAFKQGNSGVKLCAMKFVEALILLYTPHEGMQAEFNISILRGGHHVLNIGDLSIEASQILGLLLDQLRHPAAKSLNSSTIIVLINSLSSVAKKRPAYCGRILPVLLSLDPLCFLKGVHAAAANLALKSVFLSCLKCTHPAAAPWKDRLIGALKDIEGGSQAGKAEDLFHKTNGSIQDTDDLQVASVSGEESPPCTGSVVAESSFGRKRSGSDNNSDLNGDALSGKRARITSSVSEESTDGLNGNDDGLLPQVASTSTEPSNNRGVSDSGPVQQLVAMFGALVAQGEKAIGSLEILISSISADLLADVVMANMHNIPRNGSYADGIDELVMNMCIIGSDAQITYPPSFVAGVLSLSTTFPPIAALISSHAQKTQNEGEELRVDHMDQRMFPAEDAVLATGSSDASFSENLENIEIGIPGLVSSAQHDVLSEDLITSVSGSTNVEPKSKNQNASFTGKQLVDIIPSVSVDKSEEFSPKAADTVSNSLVLSTATSVALAPQFVLPKISAPVVNLSDEEKDSLQKLVLLRIVEAYKQISMSGGSQLRFSLLAHLGVEFPSELDPWKILQEHVLSDYMNHEGHELTVRVLYRLYGEAEAEQDFFSSTTAASAYESFLLTVAETLRDSFPPSDKSLSKLLGDSPFLPKSVLMLLESFCCPGSGDKVERDLQSGDRVTQGLSTVWSLILMRPVIRNDCLKIALQSAVHHLEEIRMKAIRLVANKLYSLPFITQQIEEFAKDRLLSVVSCISSGNATGLIDECKQDQDLENPPNKPQSVVRMDTLSESASSTSVSEAQRCLSLYFALCTKKHSLFVHVFSIYKKTSDPVKQAIHRQIPILVRTMGSSSELLQIIADPPSGSENLLIQVLQTLTEGATPSSELILTIRKLFDTRIKDVEILFPILPFLPRDDILRIFPHMVNLPMDKFQVALSRVLQGSSLSGSVLSPSEVLIAIHSIDPAKDGIPLKQVTDACNTCFAQRQTFTQQVLAGVLNQLVQQIPLPMLFMRTVLQAIGAFPALLDFILEILSRLVSKQIWKYPKLWVGFLKCAQTTQPQSYKVLLQLPPPQLGNALTKVSALRAPLTVHASQPEIRSSLPRSTLAVLGLVPDSQGTQMSQMQASETQTSQLQVSETQTSQEQQQASEPQQSSQSQQVPVPFSQSETDLQETSLIVASQSQSSPIGTGLLEMSQSQSSPTGRSQSEMSQSQSSPIGKGMSELSRSQNIPTGIGRSEMSPSENSPIGTGLSEMSQSQNSPIGAGQSEMSRSQNSPIGAGQSEMSSDCPPAPTSHTRTSDSQTSSQVQPGDEKIDDTATLEDETTTEIKKEKSSSVEEEE